MNVDESALTAQISWQYSPGCIPSGAGASLSSPTIDVEFDSSSVDGGYSRALEVTSGTAPGPSGKWNVNAAFYRAYRIPSLYPGVSW